VHLAGARVLVTAVGPQVPAQGRVPVPATTPCRFLVTFVAASAPIPLKPGAFTIADELHRLHHPRVSTLGGGPVPARVRPGQHLTIALDEVLPTGNGQLRWSPSAAKPIVSWDFAVEMD
jgi:hypothetical protein